MDIQNAGLVASCSYSSIKQCSEDQNRTQTGQQYCKQQLLLRKKGGLEQHTCRAPSESAPDTILTLYIIALQNPLQGIKGPQFLVSSSTTKKLLCSPRQWFTPLSFPVNTWHVQCVPAEPFNALIHHIHTHMTYTQLSFEYPLVSHSFHSLT